MPNQSIISVPFNVQEPIVLTRFLTRLVEQLDIVLGKRSGENTQYVDQSQLIESANSLEKALEEAKNSLELAISQANELSEESILKLLERIETVEVKNIQQDNRLNVLEQENLQQDLRLDALENVGFITDAPSDGNTYGRLNGAWVIIP